MIFESIGYEESSFRGGGSPGVRLFDDVEFAGQAGSVEPRVTPVNCGEWVRITETIDSRATGLTIMCHPSHPGFPPGWILRGKNSMQNVAWPGRAPVILSVKTATLLR